MFQELKTFIHVVEFNNFTKAGEYLNLSQPSVSTHIKNLENYFGVKLINRSVKQKKILITDSGYKLYEKAKEIMSLLDITYMEVRNNTDTLKGKLKIGASLTIGEYLLPRFISYFTNKYPDIDVELSINNTYIICNNIKNLTLDIGLVEGSPTHGNFIQKYFYKDSMVLAYSIDNKGFSINNLNDQVWIARENGSGTREFFDVFLETQKITPKKLIVLGSNYAIKEAVKNNLGISLISSLVTNTAVQNNSIKVDTLNNNYYRYFSYITPKNVPNSKLITIFLSELSNYMHIKL